MCCCTREALWLGTFLCYKNNLKRHVDNLLQATENCRAGAAAGCVQQSLSAPAKLPMSEFQNQ